MTKYEDEVELAPGIFLTKRVADHSSTKTKEIETEAVKQVSSNLEGKHREFLEQHPKEHYEWIKAEIYRIENSLAKLEYSNREMLAVDDTDPDFTEAVKENLIIMERQRIAVHDYKKKARELASTLGVCFQESEEKQFEKPSSEEIIDDLEHSAEGVYL